MKRARWYNLNWRCLVDMDDRERETRDNQRAVLWANLAVLVLLAVALAFLRGCAS